MHTKRLLLYVFIAFRCAMVSAQLSSETSFDSELKKLTDALAGKMVHDSALKMAVWDLSELNGGVSPIGKYIAEDISINLSDHFHITNRNQLQTLLKENRLASEGFINQATLRQVKKLSDIDIMITGTVSVLSSDIKITLQALDVNGNIVAATKGTVPQNADVKELLGINTGEAGGSPNRGFNRPLNSNEQYNNPKTVSADCEQKNAGDYCFVNQTQRNLLVRVQNSPTSTVIFSRSVTLGPSQTQCFYDLPGGAADYQYMDVSYSNYQAHGQLLVEKCKSKTFVIK